MKTGMKIAAIAALLPLLCGWARADSFLRPIVSFDSPTTDGFKDTVGYGFVAGTYLGENRTHELSFEFHYNDWDYSSSYAGYSVKGSERNMPYLLNYRYHFGAGTDKARFYVGPSLGFTKTRLNVDATLSDAILRVESSDWAFSWGGSAGVLINLTDQTDLDLGYRYLNTDGRNVTVTGTTVHIDDRKTHMLYAGLNIRF